MKALFNTREKGRIVLAISLVLMVFVPSQGKANADNTTTVNPTIYLGGIIPLTPGASTTVEASPGNDWGLTTVVCIGAGTLSVELSKDDTKGDVVSMFIMGFPADPSLVPNVGVTPAKISVSTDIGDTLGGVGVVFIFYTVNSGDSHKCKLSIKLTPPKD